MKEARPPQKKPLYKLYNSIYKNSYTLQTNPHKQGRSAAAPDGRFRGEWDTEKQEKRTESRGAQGDFRGVINMCVTLIAVMA